MKMIRFDDAYSKVQNQTLSEKKVKFNKIFFLYQSEVSNLNLMSKT